MVRILGTTVGREGARRLSSREFEQREISCVVVQAYEITTVRRDAIPRRTLGK